MKLPPGGNTCFSNMYKAYENIPRPLRDKLEGKKVLQVHDYKRRSGSTSTRSTSTACATMAADLHHPSGDRAEIALHQPADVGEDRRPVEGRERGRVEQLFDISEDPAIVYEHEWKLGDLVIWDNWCSIHARKDFPREEPRLMRRLTIEGQAMRF